MNKKHTLWIEKYRSKNPDEYIGNEVLSNKLKEWISEKDIPHLIFNGPAGTGKTTIAKLLINNIPCDYLYVNASDENGIETIREKIKGFASTRSLNGIKIIILDEADFLTNPAQAALRNLMEEYSANTRFILTCNYIEKIIEPLLSRAERYTLSAPPKKDIAVHLMNILEKENISFNLEDVVNLIMEHYPDIRSIIKYLQSGSKSGKFVFTTDMQIWTHNLLDLLTNKNNKTWYEIRQLVADSHIKDFAPAYKYLYDHVEVYGNEKEAQITIILDEYSWRSGVVPDKEITFMAAIAKILETI